MGKRISIEKREGILRRLEESDLSVAEYCRRRGLRYATVMRWRREARVSKRSGAGVTGVTGVAPAVAAGSGAAFVEVEVAQGKRARSAQSAPLLRAELALADGVLLRIYEDTQSGGSGLGS